MFANVKGLLAIVPFKNTNLPSGSIFESWCTQFRCLAIRMETPLVFASGFVEWKEMG